MSEERIRILRYLLDEGPASSEDVVRAVGLTADDVDDALTFLSATEVVKHFSDGSKELWQANQDKHP